MFPGVKRLGREAAHSPKSTAQVKNGGAIPPLPTRLNGVALNLLSTGTTLPYLPFTFTYYTLMYA
jgi:hypothetical protein